MGTAVSMRRQKLRLAALAVIGAWAMMLPLEVSEAVDLSAQTPVSLDVGGSSLERDEAVLRHDEAKALHDEGGEWHAGGSNLEHDEDNARRDDGGEEGHVNHQQNAGEPTFQGKMN